MSMSVPNSFFGQSGIGAPIEKIDGNTGPRLQAASPALIEELVVGHPIMLS